MKTFSKDLVLLTTLRVEDIRYIQSLKNEMVKHMGVKGKFKSPPTPTPVLMNGQIYS